MLCSERSPVDAFSSSAALPAYAVFAERESLWNRVTPTVCIQSGVGMGDNAKRSDMDSAVTSRWSEVPSSNSTLLVESSFQDDSIQRGVRRAGGEQRAEGICPEVRHAATVIRRILRQPPGDLDVVQARLKRVAQLIGMADPSAGGTPTLDSHSFFGALGSRSCRHRTTSWSRQLAIRLAYQIVRRIGRMCTPRGDSL